LDLPHSREWQTQEIRLLVLWLQLEGGDSLGEHG